MGEMRTARYLGANRLVLDDDCARAHTTYLRIGFGARRQVLLQPYCPPYYPTMKEAVQAVLDVKFGRKVYSARRRGHSAWRDPNMISNSVADHRRRGVKATIAYCEYIHHRYGRFPVIGRRSHSVGLSGCHLDSNSTSVTTGRSRYRKRARAYEKGMARKD